jgi:hypothetical protein
MTAQLRKRRDRSSDSTFGRVARPREFKDRAAGDAFMRELDRQQKAAVIVSAVKDTTRDVKETPKT